MKVRVSVTFRVFVSVLVRMRMRIAESPNPAVPARRRAAAGFGPKGSRRARPWLVPPHGCSLSSLEYPSMNVSSEPADFKHFRDFAAFCDPRRIEMSCGTGNRCRTGRAGSSQCRYRSTLD